MQTVNPRIRLTAQRSAAYSCCRASCICAKPTSTGPAQTKAARTPGAVLPRCIVAPNLRQSSFVVPVWPYCAHAYGMRDGDNLLCNLSSKPEAKQSKCSTHTMVSNKPKPQTQSTAKTVFVLNVRALMRNDPSHLVETRTQRRVSARSSNVVGTGSRAAQSTKTCKHVARTTVVPHSSCPKVESQPSIVFSWSGERRMTSMPVASSDATGIPTRAPLAVAIDPADLKPVPPTKTVVT
jgi:hypothetical protein